MHSFYRVDHEDRIVETGGAWDVFARDNGGTPNATDALIGRYLTDTISGDTQKMYIRTVLQRARLAKHPVESDYFCHAPDEMRHARMKLTGHSDGSVLVEHSFLSTHHRIATPNADTQRWVPNWVPPLKQCIECDRVRAPSGWVEPEAWPVLPRQNLFKGYCPDCQSTLRSSAL